MSLWSSAFHHLVETSPLAFWFRENVTEKRLFWRNCLILRVAQRGQRGQRGGQRGRGWCRPAVSALRAGLCVDFVGLQLPREAWAAFRWASLCVMENPEFPSSWDKITSTCLRGETRTSPSLYPSKTSLRYAIISNKRPSLGQTFLFRRCSDCWAANLCRGGTLSTALRLPRVDTTLKLSLQSHDTWRWCLGCLFSTITMRPAHPWVR